VYTIDRRDVAGIPGVNMKAIDRDLLKRLPRTFVPALNEQLNKGDLLFPAEQRVLQGQLAYLAGLTPRDFDELFRPVKDIEAKMRLPAWEVGGDRLSISDTSLLVRSPYYPQWRSEVEKVFARIDDAIETAKSRKPRRSVVVCVLPAGLPFPPGSPWLRPETAGRTLELRTPFGAEADQFLRSLARHADSALEPAERTWVFEAGDGLSRSLAQGTEGLTVLSFETLGPMRKEFLRRLNVVRKDLRSADQAFEELRRLDLAPLLGEKMRRDPRLSGFVRDLFLSGNGALLFGNSFVEWGATEAMRRAQPQLLICSFGIRSKLKPFSSLAVFEDQGRANPAPEQDDAPASLIDAQILAEYVYLTTLRLPAYAERTLGVFAIDDHRAVQVTGLPPSAAWSSEPLSSSELAGGIVRWLEEDA
jgi:hypothetical protein